MNPNMRMNGQAYHQSNNQSNNQSYQQKSVSSPHHLTNQRCRGTVVTLQPLFFFIKPDSTNPADRSSINNVYCLKSNVLNGHSVKVGDKVEYSLIWNDRHKQHRAQDVQICESAQSVTSMTLQPPPVTQSSFNQTTDQASHVNSQKPITQPLDRINPKATNPVEILPRLGNNQTASPSTTQFVQFKGSNIQSHNQSPPVIQSSYQTASVNGERPYETQQYNMFSPPAQQISADPLMAWSHNSSTFLDNSSIQSLNSSQLNQFNNGSNPINNSSTQSAQVNHFINGTIPISNQAITQSNQYSGHSQASQLSSGNNQAVNHAAYQVHQQSQANHFDNGLNQIQGEPDPKSIDNTAKQSNHQYFGTVHSVLPGYYFIQMDDPSDEIRIKNPDGKVFCMPSQIKSERAMQVGDRVQFAVWLTSTGKNKGKHTAINVKLCASTTNQMFSPPINQHINQAPVLPTNRLITQPPISYTKPQKLAASILANNQKRDAINQSSSTNHLVNPQMYQGHVVKVFHAKGFVHIKPNHESSIRLPSEVSDSVFCHFSNIVNDQLLYPNDEVRFSIKTASLSKARDDKKYEAATVSVVRFVDPRLEGMTWTKLAADSNASIVFASNSASSSKHHSKSKNNVSAPTQPIVQPVTTNNNRVIPTPKAAVLRQSAGFIYEINHSMNPQKRVGVVGLTMPLPQNQYVINFTYQSLKTVDQPLHLNDLVIFNLKGTSISDLEPTLGKPINHFDADSDRQFIMSLNKCNPSESHFLRGHKVNTDETRTVEFKSLSLSTNPNPLIRFNAQKYTSSFLHSDGGVLWTGISDSGVVEGLSFDQKRRDEVRLLIDGAMSSISPSVPTDKYSVTFHQVWDKVSVPKEAVDMFSSEYNVNEDKCNHYVVMLPDVYVLSISVVADPKHTYFTSGVLEDGTEGSTKAYLRRDGSTREMSSAELMRRMNEISHREKEELSEQLRKKDEMLANLMSRLEHGSPASPNSSSNDLSL